MLPHPRKGGVTVGILALHSASLVPRPRSEIGAGPGNETSIMGVCAFDAKNASKAVKRLKIHGHSGLHYST